MLTWRLLILLQGNVDVVTASVRFFISIRIVDDQDVAALDLVGDIIAPLFLHDAVGRLEPQRFDDVIPHPHIYFLDSHASPHRRVAPYSAGRSCVARSVVLVRSCGSPLFHSA